MNTWEHKPFKDVFDWCEKSNIKSGAGKQTGKYKMFVCSDIEIKRYDDYLEENESLVFGTGGKASCHYVNEKFAYSTDCIVAQKKTEDVFTKFYYYYFRQRNMGELQDTFTGSGLEHTSRKKVGNIVVPVPSLHEQERIVAKIEELFAELDKSVAALKKAKEQVEVYRKDMYSQRVFSQFREVTITDITTEIHIGPFGTMLHKSDYVENGIPIINPMNIVDGKIIVNNMITVSEKKAEELKGYVLKKNDIVMGRRGEMGRTAPVEFDGLICGTGSIYFRLKPEFDNVLYSKILSSSKVVSFLTKNAVGTTLKNLNDKIVAKIKVPYIDRKMQKKIITNCSQINDTMTQSLEQIKLDIAQADILRQTILKKAFEGEL